MAAWLCLGLTSQHGQAQIVVADPPAEASLGVIVTELEALDAENAVLQEYLELNLGSTLAENIEAQAPIVASSVLGRLAAIQSSIGSNAVLSEASNISPAGQYNLLGIMAHNLAEYQVTRRTLADVYPPDVISELLIMDASLTTPLNKTNRAGLSLAQDDYDQSVLAGVLADLELDTSFETMFETFALAETGVQLGVTTLDMSTTIENFFEEYDQYHAKSLPTDYLAEKANSWDVETGAMIAGMYASLGFQYGGFIPEIKQIAATMQASRLTQGVLQSSQVTNELLNLILKQIQKSRIMQMETLSLLLSDSLKMADAKALQTAHSSQIMAPAVSNTSMPTDTGVSANTGNDVQRY